MRTVLSVLACALFATAATTNAQQRMDQAYADKIAEFTTDDRFVNEWVDHLPESDSVPSPLEYFGTIIGDPSTLHYTSEIYGYLRAVADASPRVRIRSIGTTEENREMIEVIISSEQNLEDLEANRLRLNRLADPRLISEAEAQDVIRVTTPIYYITAGLHSPETGSPEMVMELTYRLAVEENNMIQAIRENVVFIFTPVAEPDGRDRVVDTYRYAASNEDVGPKLTYWGAYVAHDNNRDGFGLALKLTRNLLGSFLHWKPQVMHDLHESANYLYVSTGLGPYNEYIDPITIDEWHNLAHEEVSELTRKDMPGVYTHAFYNGWAANYLIWIANTRNSIGRFYETRGNSRPGTYELKLNDSATSRKWYRPNPPLEKTTWSLRNNTNYMQSGVLVALKYTADNATRFVENFYLKSRRALERGRDEAPFAWVFPTDQLRPIGTVNLINILIDQGLEVHQAREDLEWTSDEDTLSASAGSYVVRLDQPYSTLAHVLLDRQNFPKGADPPYDDTGWTLPLMHNVTFHKVEDASILEADMQLLSEHVRVDGGIEPGSGSFFIVNNSTDDNFSVFRFRLKNVAFFAAEDSFSVDDTKFNAGSFIIEKDGNGRNLSNRLDEVAVALGVTVHVMAERPKVSMHEVEVPRIGLIHTWVATPQDAGWWQIGFDKIGIPYDYLSEQDLTSTDLKDYDVLILPRTRASSQSLVAGNSRVGEPLPWKRSRDYPHIGHIDETSDARVGMGYDGLAKLKRFIEEGGVFITEGPTSAFPIDMALIRRVSIRRTPNLKARGSIVKTVRADSMSPILYGYGESLPAYFNQSPVFQVNKNVGGRTTPDWYKDEAWSAEVPRTVLEFAKEGINLSGMLTGESELTGKPAVLDVPVGEGHVILFAIRPFRRWNTQGSHALVFNTILHWNDLRVGWPERPSDDDEETPAVDHHWFEN